MKQYTDNMRPAQHAWHARIVLLAPKQMSGADINDPGPMLYCYIANHLLYCLSMLSPTFR